MSSQLCPCRGLHRYCDPAECIQQCRAPLEEYSTTFRELRKSVADGCTTCTTLLNGLRLPSIQQVWLDSIDQGLKSGLIKLNDVEKLVRKEDAVGIAVVRVNRDRVIIRTVAFPDSTLWRHFNFNAKIPATTSSGCRPFPVLQTSFVDRTDSEVAYGHLQRWLCHCEDNHSCAPRGLRPSPSRLLDISGNQVHLHVLKLFHCSRYTTLSHRWGPNEEFKLKNENFSDFTKGIPWSRIPKTIQHAIEISRKLGVTYLWVDLLCIIQDDKDDWEEQAQKMSSIYKNSFLNIAAVESHCSSGGCFRHTDIATRHTIQEIPGDSNVVVMQQPVHTHKDFGRNYTSTSDSPPLFQRGWVFQERLLSPRVVYYAKDEILWACCETSECLCGAINVLAPFKSEYNRLIAVALATPLAFAWTAVVERYSDLKLTYESDRLVALAGIVEAVRRSTTWDY